MVWIGTGRRADGAPQTRVEDGVEGRLKAGVCLLSCVFSSSNKIIPMGIKRLRPKRG